MKLGEENLVRFQARIVEIGQRSSTPQLKKWLSVRSAISVNAVCAALAARVLGAERPIFRSPRCSSGR